MRSYVERTIFHETAMAVWADAVDLVKRVSDHYGNEVRCHELARAAHKALIDLNMAKLIDARAALSIADGMLWGIEHSWLVYSWLDPHAPVQFILDVYCPGRLPQVQLIHTHYSISRGYNAGGARTDIKQSMVEQLTREMQRGT